MNKPKTDCKNRISYRARLSALELITNYLRQAFKADVGIATYYRLHNKNTEERRICQCIFFAFFRNKLLIDKFLLEHLRAKTKPKMYAFLCLCCAELVDNELAKQCKTADYLVDISKKIFSVNESKFINAMLRNFLKFYEKIKAEATSISDFAILYSMPQFITERFSSQYGEEIALEIIKSCHKAKEVFFRFSTSEDSQKALEEHKEFFEETKFNNFYKVKAYAFNKVSHLLEQKLAYAQDLSTSYAPELLAPKAGEKVLDLCSAPGGKSAYIIDLIQAQDGNLGDTLLLSCDQEGKRFEQLKENLKDRAKFATKQVAFDLLNDDLESVFTTKELPAKYDAILLDAPCSNTGVLGRRVDARYRIMPQDIENCKQMQSQMLEKALGLLAEGGRIVYSTCSIDKSENIENVEAFVAKHPELKIESFKEVLPSVEQDGAFVALIKA
ncbi:MAG: RsmB/NOP family class I SAM-dependent RNA methyltransferase [Opitutales bacterium]